LYIVEKFPRSFLIETSGKSFETPFFIPAISSIKAEMDILGYIDLIEKVGYPAFLVSAYDISKLGKKKKETMIKDLTQHTGKKILVFLDNGNYEACWYKDRNWTLEELKTVLDEVYPDFCFSFDVFCDKGKSIEEHAKETITSIAKTAGMQKTGSTIALIHSNPEHFPKIIWKVVEYLTPEIVAIPERELGSSLLEKAQTIRKVRVKLGKMKKSIPIHVLGSGNPISILIYTLCGADIYDALDWSNSFIDPKTGQLFNFSHKDLVDCQCEACKMKGVPYNYQVIAHNLIFYLDFLDEIRNSIKDGKENRILKKYLNEEIISEIRKVID